MIFSPQLLQSSDVFDSATAYKEETRWRPDMKDVFDWMLDQVDDRTIVAATDGRNAKVRFHLQSIVINTMKDENMHLNFNIMYNGKPSQSDIRFQSRKVYGALSNVESVVGVLPVSRVRMHRRMRDSFFSLRRNLYAHNRLFWSALAQAGRSAAPAVSAVQGRHNRSQSSHLQR